MGLLLYSTHIHFPIKDLLIRTKQKLSKLVKASVLRGEQKRSSSLNSFERACFTNAVNWEQDTTSIDLSSWIEYKPKAADLISCGL